MNFEDTVQFHGHRCPGLAMGYRVANLALKELGLRAKDEELVAIVENDSCAVDAIQFICGCTFGKGNLIFKDFGKQVYTFIRRPDSEAVRIAVKWEPPPEDPETEAIWDRYTDGDRSAEVVAVVKERKARKMNTILEAEDGELFKVERVQAEMPESAKIYKSITCTNCGERVIEPRIRIIEGKQICIPCSKEL